MQNWIGIAIWIVMGAVIGLAMKAFIKRPEETPGHAGRAPTQKTPATTYFPEGLPPEYLRRWRA